jgi:hypothetical protein
MHKIGMFGRKGALTQEGFTGSGAHWLDRYKPYIDDGKTVVTSPHKVLGTEPTTFYRSPMSKVATDNFS